MDEFTRESLAEWVMAQSDEFDTRNRLFDVMARFMWDADDIDYWLDKGWRIVADRAVEHSCTTWAEIYGH